MLSEAYIKIAEGRYREDFGFYFEDFVKGVIIEHRPGRTITQTDNIWSALTCMNTAQLHFDTSYAEKTEWGKPLVNSPLTLSIVTGMTVNTISKKVVANLAWDEVRLPHPVFEGDTLYAESEVLEKRESKSRPGQGIVTVDTRGYNQHQKLVISFRRTLLVYKKGHAPNYINS